jgi:hypothetical protein
MTTILVAKKKKLVVTNICNYKPCNCLVQVAKDNQLQKTPHGMYDITFDISLATTWIFHSLTSCRTIQLHIQLHKILGNILKLN